MDHLHARGAQDPASPACRRAVWLSLDLERNKNTAAPLLGEAGGAALTPWTMPTQRPSCVLFGVGGGGGAKLVSLVLPLDP